MQRGETFSCFRETVFSLWRDGFHALARRFSCFGETVFSLSRETFVGDRALFLAGFGWLAGGGGGFGVGGAGTHEDEGALGERRPGEEGSAGQGHSEIDVVQ